MMTGARADTLVHAVHSSSALERQQRAARWIEHLRGLARQGRLSPIVVGRTPIDWVDALRAELLRQVGAALVPSQPRPSRFEVADLRTAAYRAKSELRHILQRRVRPSSAARSAGPGVVLLPRLNHADLLPVARSLAQTYGWNCLYLRTEHDAPPRDLEFPVVDLEASGGILSRTALLRAWYVELGLGRLLDAAARSVSGFGEGELRAVRAVSEKVIRRHLPALVRLAYGVDAVMNLDKPKLLLVGNPTTIEGRVAAHVARSHRVPSATIEHGSILAGDPSWAECPLDLVCTWGDPSRDALVACGVPVERIRITGSPKLDARIAQLRSTRSNAATEILVATSGAGDKVDLAEHLRFIETLSEAAKATPELRWIVKLHRKDAALHYRSVPENVRVLDVDRERFGTDIFAHLRDACALVTVQSTAALDAMIAAVPVIVVDVCGGGRQRDTEYLRCARLVSDAASLASAARSAAREESHPSDEPARRYVTRHFANLGTAAAAAATALADLAVASPLQEAA